MIDIDDDTWSVKKHVETTKRYFWSKKEESPFTNED